MLLSPALATVWAPRLKRVVLDEIHSISAEEGGAIWEQVLLLNPAPIIALSATVGVRPLSPIYSRHVFDSAWFRLPSDSPPGSSPSRRTVVVNTRSSSSTFCSSPFPSNAADAVALTYSHQRYNALRKFAYVPDLPVKKIGTLQERKPKPGVFAHVHPVASLGLGVATLPNDLALEPSDTLSLWQAMVDSGAEVDPALNPATYFAKTPSIAIRDGTLRVRTHPSLDLQLMSFSSTSDCLREGLEDCSRQLDERPGSAGGRVAVQEGRRDV